MEAGNWGARGAAKMMTGTVMVVLEGVLCGGRLETRNKKAPQQGVHHKRDWRRSEALASPEHEFQVACWSDRALDDGGALTGKLRHDY